MIVRIKGVKRYQNPRTGIWYSYHRASGTRIEPPHVYGSLGFIAALAAAEDKHKSKAPLKGTWGAMVRSYRESAAFESLKKRTKADYLKLLDWLKSMDDVPVPTIDGPTVAKIRDKAFKTRKRRFANYVIAMISVVFNHGIELGLAKSNPAQGIKRIRRPTETPIANRAWTEAEKQTVLDHAPSHLIVPIAIARWTGMRQGDVIHLQRTAYKDGILNLTTRKRGVPLWFPCPKPLREILDSIPPHDGMTLCVNSFGRPWTQDGFRASFFKLIRRLEGDGLVDLGLTFHGLRTSFAEEVREKGFGLEEIADALAQNDSKSAALYTRNADRKRSVGAIAAALDETNGVQNLSTKVSTMDYSGRRTIAK